MKFKALSLLLLTLFFFSNFLFASSITIESPYVRAIPPGQTISAAFMVIKNNSDEAISLVKATSEIAETVELHEHINADGMMKMRQVPNIVIAANSTTDLKPGGYHIMLIGLKKAIKPDDIIDMTLEFSNGAEQAVKASVKKIAMGVMPKGSMKHQNIANEMQAMKHANPMPNLMKVVMKMGDQLNLSDKQSVALKQWRDEHMSASKQLVKTIVEQETNLHNAAIAGEPIDKLDMLASAIMQSRTQLIHSKALCRDNMKSILDTQQYNKVLELYVANFK